MIWVGKPKKESGEGKEDDSQVQKRLHHPISLAV